MGEITEAAHKAVDEGNESAVQTEGRFRQAASDAEMDRLEPADRAPLSSLKISDSLNGYVQEHPFTSLGIAFAAGIVVDSIFKR
jgi:ElaB/YqjD/DUF883 family membrane-anchored ribosome-binding protein